jgi:hypothetical protein
LDNLESVLAEDALPAFDPTVSRPTHRLSTILATSAEPLVPSQTAGGPPSQHLYLGRLARFYDACTDQLPRVLISEWLDPRAMAFKRWEQHGQRISRARLWVFSVPAAPMVIALSLDVQASPLQLIPLLEDCYYTEVRQGEYSLADLAMELLQRSGVALSEPDQFTSSRNATSSCSSLNPRPARNPQTMCSSGSSIAPISTIAQSTAASDTPRS